MTKFSIYLYTYLFDSVFFFVFFLETTRLVHGGVQSWGISNSSFSSLPLFPLFTAGFQSDWVTKGIDGSAERYGSHATVYAGG